MTNSTSPSKGAPAISDEAKSMDGIPVRAAGNPTDATGVPVTLDTIDPNGNYIQIGTVTSDVNGNYGIPFTPEVPGTYQIIATFDGSASYGSSGTTYMGVAESAQQHLHFPRLTYLLLKCTSRRWSSHNHCNRDWICSNNTVLRKRT